MRVIDSQSGIGAAPAEGSRQARVGKYRPASRDAAPKAVDVRKAERTYAACVAVVKIAMIGPDLRAPSLSGKQLYVASAEKLATALAVYSANNHAGIPLRHLEVALGRDRSDLRKMIAFVEDWRAAPIIDQGLEQVRRSVAVAA